jgi:uncharacterized protein (TIRG00374 family)
VVFVVVLPRIANYSEVSRQLRALSPGDLTLLLGAATVNLITFGPPWMAALPRLSLGRSLAMSQASTAMAGLLPGGDAVGLALSYSMLRSWGFASGAVALAMAATTVWNVMANICFAVAAVVALAISGESHPLLSTAALVGGVALVAGITAFALALQGDRNARRVGALAQRLAHRPLCLLRRGAPAGWDERLVAFRGQTIGLLRHRHLALTGATLAGHLTVFLVLLVAVRAVGIPAERLSVPEVFAAWALVRLLTTVAITPGGLGVVELGLTGVLVGFGGGQVRVVTAVLLYRALTYVPPIVIGGLCTLVWTHSHGRVPPPRA